jgi:hypothetical protein
MTEISPSALIAVRPSPLPGGRGVFATQFIPADTLIETAPLLPFKKADADLLEYVFITDEKEHVLALGYGSLYNHKEQPNAIVTIDIPNQCAYIHSLRDINMDEEIYIFYSPTWFKDRNRHPLKSHPTPYLRWYWIFLMFLILCGVFWYIR